MNYTIETPVGIMDRYAWTGGDTPPKGYKDPIFKYVRRVYFREFLRDCGGLDLWKCAGTSSMERARIFWNQATLNAWRTTERYRNASQHSTNSD